MTKHILCDCKCKINDTTCDSNKKWNNKTCQCECKNYRTCKKNCNWNRSTRICEDSKYLKSIANTSVIVMVLYQQKRQILQQQILRPLLQ